MKNKSIRITEFSLKNYAPLYETMGITDFHFERRNSKNNIALILGENGSGKTYLLSELTPEPIEHIEGRTSNRFLNGENGEKRIVFTIAENDTDILDYICTIKYSQNKKTTCSFIEKNLKNGIEKELNANGNVTSYIELCKTYLQYSKSFKNIGYITSNVKNIVSMSFTERQQLISSWLPDMMQYLNASKAVLKKKNRLNKDCEDILKELAGITLDTRKNELNIKKSSLSYKEDALRELEQNITTCKVHISYISSYTKEELYNKMKNFLNEVKNHNETVYKLNEKYNEMKKYFIGEYSNKEYRENKLFEYQQKIKELNDEYYKNEGQLQLFQLEIEDMKRNISIEQNDIKDKIEENSKNDELIRKTNEEISELDTTLKNYPEDFLNSSCTREKLSKINESVLNIFQICQNLLSSIGERSYSIFKSNKDSTRFKTSLEIQKREEEIARFEKENEHYQLLLQNTNILSQDSNILSLAPPHCSKETCSLIKAILEIESKSKDSDIIKNNIQNNKYSISRLKDEITNFRKIEGEIQILSNAYEKCNTFLSAYEYDIKLLPKTIQEEINKIDLYENSPIQLSDLISFIVSRLKKYEEYVSYKDKKDSLNELLIMYKNKKSNLSTIIGEFQNLLDKESVKRKELCSIKDKIKTLEENMKEIENIDFLLKELIDNKKEIKMKEEYLINKKKYLLSYNEMLNNKNFLIFAQNKLISKREALFNEISRLKLDIEKETAFINSKEVLQKQYDAKMKKIEIYDILYNTWNPRTGYPSRVIKSFLDNVVYATNKDLNTMWGGVLLIDDFILTENEFRIPIIRGNTKLEDISECCTSEKSTLSLAISFAMIDVSTENNLYNVIRIDEADGGFDSVRRQSFLDMVQERMKAIGCRNCFCITHNNCFDLTECDVILLKGYESVISGGSLSNKNILYEYKGEI